METALKSERETIQERMDKRKQCENQKSLILESAQQTVRQAELVEDMSKVVPIQKSFIQDRLDQSRENIRNGTANLGTDGYVVGEDGVESYSLQEMLDEEAIARHHNDPDARLDECGFPEDRSDRYFTLNHDFGEDLEHILNNIRSNWFYLYGDPGLGKTSLAVRAVWELIKNHPTHKATFLSIGRWTDSLKVGKEEYLPLNKLRRIVVVDDFDKFDIKKPFQISQLLLLVEELKNRHLVIFTSNYSREEILSFNPDSMNLDVMLDRIRGKSIDFPRFSGDSKR